MNCITCGRWMSPELNVPTRWRALKAAFFAWAFIVAGEWSTGMSTHEADHEAHEILFESEFTE